MVSKSAICVVLLMVTIPAAFGWENLPQLPSGKRSEYFVTKNDGGYEYGYDSGSGSFSKQSGQSNNEVNGHFSYPTIEGQLIDIKYTAGVEGYVPYTVTNNNLGTKSSYAYTAGTTKSGSANTGSPPIHKSTGYSFKTTHPSADHSSSGGAYSYTNNYGNNLKSNTAEWNVSPTPTVAVNRQYQSNDDHDEQSTGDASYNFAYNAGDSSRNEVADQSGNINGHYSYTNEAGQHDLSYSAGAGTGFVVTGGSLSIPNGLDNSATTRQQYQPKQLYNNHQHQYQPQQDQQWNLKKSSESNDGSYAFAYTTGDATRQEQSDQNGNIHGQYSYTNDAGQHDLKYIAGANTGFLVTGGSLSIPNGVDNGASTSASVKSTSASTSSAWKSKQFQTPSVVVYNVNDEYNGHNNNQQHHQSSNNDAAYDFAYQTGDSTRHEKSDSNGRIVGEYSFTNEAGQHDLKYTAGADTGFVVTGGSLSIPNGVDGGATVRQLAQTQSNNNHQHATVKSTSSGGWADNSVNSYIPPVVNTRSSESHQGLATHGAGGSYSIQYQVGGGGSNSQHSRDSSTGFAVTKLLPTNGNHKFGYILE